MKHLNFGIIVISMALLIGTATLFIYCYFGKLATESYEKMSDCLFECNWPDLHPRLQKYLIIIIGNAQRPVYYNGSGMAVLNLETFTKVSNKHE